MTKLLSAMVAAGLAFGIGTAFARDTSSNQSAGDKAATEAKQNPGSEADERRARDSTQQGQTVPGPGAGQHPDRSTSDTTAPVRTETNTGQSGNAGHPTDKMRNRDSSKQQDPNAPPKQ